MGDRRPDALLVLIGGNDIGFGKIIMNCLVSGACYKRGKTAYKTFTKGIKELPDRLDRLDEELRASAWTPHVS